MPKSETLRRARKDAAEGKAPSTQAGEFVREEIDHVRQGKHGARSTKQAIAIGLSKARRAGVKLPSPDPAKISSATRHKAELDSAKSKASKGKTVKATSGKASPRRSRATLAALKLESKQSASSAALASQARASAEGRTSKDRSAAARKAAKTRARGKS